MSGVDPQLRRFLMTAANAFRFQVDMTAPTRSGRAMNAAERKLVRAREESQRVDMPDGEELLKYSYEAILAACQALALALGYAPGANSDLGHSGVFSFARAVCSKLATEMDGPLERINNNVRPLRNKAQYDHVYPTQEEARDAFEDALLLVDGLKEVVIVVSASGR